MSSNQPTQSTPSHVHAHGFTGPVAETYNARTGGCNIRLSQHLISLVLPHLSHLPSTTPIRILDSACGPLTTTTELLSTPFIQSRLSSPHEPSNDAPHISIIATDLSPDFTRANNASLSASPPPKGIEISAREMNSEDLSVFPDGHFDASFTSIAIFAFQDPVKGARELKRTLKEGGVAGLTTWRRTWLELIWEVEDRIYASEPDALGKWGEEGKGKDEGEKGYRTSLGKVEDWMHDGVLRSTLLQAGFEDGKVEETTVETRGWWESEGKFVESLASSLGMMCGERYKEGAKGRKAFQRVLREVLGDKGRARELGVVFGGEGEEREEGWTGVRMEAFCGVARK